MSGGICDRHADVNWRWGMHGMCGGAVQQRIDGGVCGVCVGVGDKHAGGGEWYELHGV